MTKNQTTKEILLSCLSLCITTVVFAYSILYVVEWIAAAHRPSHLFYAYNALFVLLITAFAYGNFLYQAMRLGHHLRLRKHNGLDNSKLISYVAHTANLPTLSVLIPSYKEEVRTVEQTLLSAALLGYRNKQISVLLDDPSSLPGTSDYRHTRKTIKMIEATTELMAETYTLHDKLYKIVRRRLAGDFEVQKELRELAITYRLLAKRLSASGNRYKVHNHTDKFFVRNVIRDAAAVYRQRAMQVRKLHLSDDEARTYILEEYAYMRDMFNTRITILQRKAFNNLSQEPNKAMNINSYISLMGGAYIFAQSNSFKPALVPTTNYRKADLIVPETDYVITLDADSILNHGYAATLIEIMERPGNERIAVAQTPYSAIPGAHNILERTAGATTDIQYIIHQGFTKFGATYWVGANALLRKTALNDIAEPIEGEPLMRRYIQDRTVIEDTESSIDLIRKSWSLYNYPKRMAYSATPNDYGSLLIQRRRWANGGLIILPKLLAYLFLRPSFKKVPEGLLRTHYLVSIAGVNLSLVVMLFVPLDDVGFSYWVPLTAVPYFYLYARDLRMLGYGRLEMFRVYALNLLLIPINIGGVCKSIQQLIMRNKIPFGRTPKVDRRTMAPPLYHITTYSLFGYLVFSIVNDVIDGQFVFAGLLAINTLFLGYALVVFVGVKEAISDVGLRLRKLATLNKKLIKAQEIA